MAIVNVSLSISRIAQGWDILSLPNRFISSKVKIIPFNEHIEQFSLSDSDFSGLIAIELILMNDLGGSHLFLFLQLRRFLGSRDGSTYIGVSPKRFTPPPCAVILFQCKAPKNGTNWDLVAV